VEAHALQPVQQRAGVLQHDARLFAGIDQLPDVRPHPPVTLVKHARVVVVSRMLVIEHVLQVADQRCARERAGSCRDQRLMHVQRDRAGAAHAAEVDAGLREQGLARRAGASAGHGRLRSGDAG
jgi:hypothetical protein